MKKVVVFTSDCLRHTSLLNSLARYGYQVTAWIEPRIEKTLQRQLVLPDNLKYYFKRLNQAENEIFGLEKNLSPRIKSFFVPFGSISNQYNSEMKLYLDEANAVIVFGFSYVREPLITKLIAKKSINIHTGISPQYRGVDCNFWALFDNNPQFVGATIHFLDRGLDSGDILRYVYLDYEEISDLFYSLMNIVKSAQMSLIDLLEKESFFEKKAIKQNSTELIRYTRTKDFTEEVAIQYFQKEKDLLKAFQIIRKLNIAPYFSV
ncbi:MAG: formyltransferase family protein [Pseudomonadota bacterium]|jgi:methionyl-tRNA formyltransferase